MGNRQAIRCNEATRMCVDECGQKVLGKEMQIPSTILASQQLIQAARSGNEKLLNDAISKGAYLETRRPMAMVTLDDISGPEITTTHLEGLTPLMHAANNGALDCVLKLLAAKAKVNAKEQDGWQPLHFAASSGNLEVGMALVGAGADATVHNSSDVRAVDCLPEDVLLDLELTKAWRRLLGTEEVAGNWGRAAIRSEDLVEVSGRGDLVKKHGSMKAQSSVDSTSILKESIGGQKPEVRRVVPL